MEDRSGNSRQTLCRTAAAVAVVFALSAFVQAIDTASYKRQVDAAREHVSEMLGYAETGEAYPIAEKNALAAASPPLPATETVESNGQPIEVSNQWFHTRLADVENESNPKKRALYLAEIDEMLSALSAQLEEPPAAAERSKDEYKRKLAEILARQEYQKPAAQEGGGLAGLIERFINWLRSLFPNAGPADQIPFDFSGFAKVLQVILFAVIFGLIGFLLYKFAPLLTPAARRGARVKKSHRTILGERIAADRSSGDLFAEAEALARGGDIRAAIRKGYIALLCDLSDRNIISLEQHKTNRDYPREVRNRQALY